MQGVPRRNCPSPTDCKPTETEWTLTEESIREQEEAMAHYTALLQGHKEEAQAGLEYYRRLTSETESTYRRICILQQQDLVKSAELKKRHLTLCLDNARICKNQYLVAWAMELVEKKRFTQFDLSISQLGTKNLPQTTSSLPSQKPSTILNQMCFPLKCFTRSPSSKQPASSHPG